MNKNREVDSDFEVRVIFVFFSVVCIDVQFQYELSFEDVLYVGIKYLKFVSVFNLEVMGYIDGVEGEN